MSKGGRYLKKKAKSKGKKVTRVVLCVLAVLVVGLAVAGVLAYNSILNKINRAEVIEQDVTMNSDIEALMGIMEETEPNAAATTEATTEATTLPAAPLEPNALNILVVGQSYRPGEESRLADTIMLFTLNKNTKVVTVTSFLRDTYVDLPDYMGHPCGWNRINTCYALGYLWGSTGGAMEMTNLCLKNNFGIEVDYNVEIGFDAFIDIIYLLDGVWIELTEAEADYLNGPGKTIQEVTPGGNLLYGDAALSYARMRKAEGDADSDIKRTDRQRKLVEAILKKLMKKGPSVIQELSNQILPMVTTSANMTNAVITDLMMELLPMLPEITIEKGTGPVANDVLKGSQWAEYKELPDGGAYVQVFDRAKNMEYFKTLTEGLITVLPEPTTEATTEATAGAATETATETTTVPAN